jgi:hypothetical protein
MKTGLKRVIAFAPTGRQPSWGVVHFENLDLIAAFLRIDGGT